MNHRPLTTGEVAQHCHVTYRAVLKWIAAGKLKAYRTPGKHSRVEVEDFIDFLSRYNMPIPQEFGATNNKKRVLIVDDDRGMVHSMRRTLASDKRFEIDVAYDGFSAGQKFSQFRPHLVILDIKMPGMDGYEVCSRIRSNSKNKDVKIIAISGLVEKEVAEKILKLGANDYLPKPFDNRLLKEKVEKLIG